ncbi:rubredoxin-like domain-containing protein [Sinanaerobacter chloroacetimidivorans]|jgi:rubredoxin|uniref:Rubredoxin n=1 Tax=Sinanaerobacter chloroacetimidivorans TaxID=2818044 RepID=A0A8J8B1S5_9FIRM|nr:rubredoxin [Sinanaerobacter chloroacetimidivorans]MBR0598042.1 rubredoxin [Sinanaerobacter chloroacetimidivorans]
MKMLWKCSVCRFTHEGDQAPEKCPKCGAPAEKFNALSEEDAQKIYASDRTNDIHMEIANLAMRIAELAEEGIKIDLDPPCVAVFTNAKKEAWIIKQRSKAELSGHMEKGKW